MQTMDDAGVYLICEDTALVQTVDFFFPIVNDPRSFGRIAAANSMSDIWAMGAKAITAMNILAYPAGQIPHEAIEELLTGAAEKLHEAGVVLLGGHTMEQEDMLFGMSVTGITSPSTALTNDNAKPGDLILLTKPLGTGIYCDAMLGGGLNDDQLDAFVYWMERLNKYSSEIMQRFDISCLTDVTGFGLLGHALPIARNAGVRLVIEASRVPLLPGLPDLLSSFNPKGVCKCEEYVAPYFRMDENVDNAYRVLFSEAQTSGGLLATVAPDQAETLVRTLIEHGDTETAVIGQVKELEDPSVFLEIV
jgi:selenide, water dikinase